MFRTNASKEPLKPEMKLILREIHSIIFPKAKEFIGNDDNREKSHEKICALLLRFAEQYVSYVFRLIQDPLTILLSHYEYGISQEKSNENFKPHPPMWELNYNSVFAFYCVFYRGVTIDPNIFLAITKNW